ncbi:MAG: 2-hydroxy-3-oxopropionate reductase [Firmicutes bacterium ADurb.Bin356]|nr:MAG: 2-hydroxy-3-oxopropionate reductase [Firmicutes bacterium ADurb.Bin356]
MKTIGFIGTGIMGSAMAGHLLEAGYNLRVYNRTKAKAQALLEKGAIWCETPALCAKGAEAVISIVGYPKDVEAIYLGEGGLIEKAAPGTYLIDMTTSSPALAIKIYNAAKKAGLNALDAPVTGGDIGAKNAALTIMAGGDKEAFDACKELFSKLGRQIGYVGGPGAGQHAKMANQIAIAGTIAGLSEALAYVKRVGADAEAVLSLISSGSAASRQMDTYAARILSGDFAAGFYIKHFCKDMGIALTEASQRGLLLEVLKKVNDMYASLCDEGMENLGTQALIQYYD